MSSQYQHSFLLPLNSTTTTSSPYTSNSTTFEASPISPLSWLLGDDEDQARRWSSFIGIVVAISGNILISLAINVQKYAHIRLDREQRKLQLELQSQENSGTGTPTDEGRPSEDTEGRPLLSAFDRYNTNGTSGTGSTYAHSDQVAKKESSSGGPKYLKSPLWWLGIILMCLGECGNFMAYGFASASIVSPLGVVALISNCIIAPLMLKEPFRRQDLFGVLVSIAGAVVVVSSAAPEEKKLGPDEILRAISQTAFEVYFAICCGLIITFLYLSRRYGRRYVLIDLTLVGLFGGFTVLATKGVSSLLSSSFYRIVTMPIAYLFLFVLVSTAILQIKYLNRALQRFDSTQVIPIQFVLFTISVIVGSAILYRDFEKLDRKRLIRFIIGCALTFGGVWLISSDRPQNGSDDHLETDPEAPPEPTPLPTPPIITTTNINLAAPPVSSEPINAPHGLLSTSRQRPLYDRTDTAISSSSILPHSFNPDSSSTSRRNSLIAARVPPVLGYHLQAAIGEHVAETIRDAVVSKRRATLDGKTPNEGRQSLDEVVQGAVVEAAQETLHEATLGEERDGGKRDAGHVEDTRGDEDGRTGK